jgi:uncharacterized repeat protein (TIGR03809 family)
MELTDAARGRGIIERWCVLAEQRLDYLTELFETGRWRRYFGEVAFLENIQEAKLAVETWRNLLNREATPDNRPVDLSWLGRRSTLPPRRIGPSPQQPSAAVAAPIVIAAPPSAPPPVPAILAAAPSEIAPVPSIAPDQQEAPDAWQYALSPDRMQQRYPLLRNAF